MACCQNFPDVVLKRFNVWTVVFGFASVMDCLMTGTVYIFVANGFQRTKGTCVSGQLTTEVVLYVLFSVLGIAVVIKSVKRAGLKINGCAGILFCFMCFCMVPLHLLIDNNLMIHCWFESKFTKSVVLGIFAFLLIAFGLLRVVMIPILNVPFSQKKSKREVKSAGPTRGTEMRQTASASPSNQRNASQHVGYCQSWCPKVCRKNWLRAPLITITYASAVDQIMSGVQNIFLERGFQPSEGKCLSGQLPVEGVFLGIFTVIGLCLSFWTVGQLPVVHVDNVCCLRKICMTSCCRKLINVVLALVAVPLFCILDNSQIWHCLRKTSSGGAFSAAIMYLLFFVLGYLWLKDYKDLKPTN